MGLSAGDGKARRPAVRAAAVLALLCGAVLAGCAPIERAFDLAPPNMPKKTAKRPSPMAQAMVNADSIDLYQGPTSAPQGGSPTGARGQVPPPVMAQGDSALAFNGTDAGQGGPQPLHGGGAQALDQPVRVADVRPPAQQPAYKPTTPPGQPAYGPSPPSQTPAQGRRQPAYRPAPRPAQQDPYQATRAAQERRIAEYEARQGRLRAQGAPAPLTPGEGSQQSGSTAPGGGPLQPARPVRVASANEQVPYPAPPGQPAYRPTRPPGQPVHTGSTQGPAQSGEQIGGGPRPLSPPGNAGNPPARPLEANTGSSPPGNTVPPRRGDAEPDPEDLPDNSAAKARGTIWDWAKIDEGRHTREKTPVERLREARKILGRNSRPAYGSYGAPGADGAGPVPYDANEPTMLGLRGGQDMPESPGAPSPGTSRATASAPRLDAGKAPAPAAGAPAAASLSRQQPMRVYFQPGTAALSSQTIASIVSVARVQKARGGRVHVVGLGPADSGGQGGSGQLAEARANAVAQELTLQGVARENIVAAARQAQTSRVEVFIE